MLACGRRCPLAGLSVGVTFAGCDECVFGCIALKAVVMHTPPLDYWINTCILWYTELLSTATNYNWLFQIDADLLQRLLH